MKNIFLKQHSFKDLTLPSLALGLLIFYCLLFPADLLNIKELLLAFTLLVCSPAIFRALKSRRQGLLCLFAVIYPVLLVVLAVTAGDSALGDAVSEAYVWVYLLLIPAVTEWEIDIKRPFFAACILVALIIDFIWLTDLFGIIPMSANPVGLFFDRMGEMQTYSKGSLATFGYAIYYKSVAVLLFGFGYAVKEKRIVSALLIFAAFIASGGRANLIIAILVAGLILVFCSKTKNGRMIAVCLGIAAAIVVLPRVVDTLISVTTLKFDSSESIKLGGIVSTFTFMNDRPYTYLFGSGVGSYYFSSGRMAMVNIIEPSFIDYFRKVGIVGFVPLIWFLVRPLGWLWRNERWLLFTYLGYIVIAATNPILLNSTAMIAYLLVFSCAFSPERGSLFDQETLCRGRLEKQKPAAAD